jgi:hypothetical protein
MRTFVVRLFEPAPGAGPVTLRGVVEDVRTGTTTSFRSEEQLLAAIMLAPWAEGENGPDKGVGPDG